MANGPVLPHLFPYTHLTLSHVSRDSMNLCEATLQSQTKKDLNPGFSMGWLCNLKGGCLTSLCLQLFLYQADNYSPSQGCRGACRKERLGVHSAHGLHRSFSITTMVQFWARHIFVVGRLSWALWEAEQHSWTLPTRCQQDPQF